MSLVPVLTLSPQFERRLLAVLHGQPANARDVLRLSDFYIANPGSETPWDDDNNFKSYLTYFLPLNVARLHAVWRDVRRFLNSNEIQEIYDFGSGLGATQWMLENETEFVPRPLHCLEASDLAIRGHQQLLQAADSAWQPLFNTKVRPGPGALAVFSYSFLEMRNCLPDLDQFTHILIVEPSTRECGRQLMNWRQAWIEKGYTPLAPCTHALTCPLLKHSGRDWCHMRVAFSPPQWLQTLEENLPMKNRSLTYSYLLLSRGTQKSTHRGSIRVIGDTLDERGKTRQMICRSDEREFLSWLKRDGPSPRIPHGALIKTLNSYQKKGPEVRAERDLQWEF